MSNAHPSPPQATQTLLERESPVRKAYEPPQILSREPLEALANVCAGATSKAVPEEMPCNIGPLQS